MSLLMIRRVRPSYGKGGLLDNITHGVAALVELCSGEFVGACGVDGEKEKAALCAECFFTTCGVPAFVEAFRVKDDETPPALKISFPQTFSQGLIKVEMPAHPGPRRLAFSIASHQRVSVGFHFREH